MGFQSRFERVYAFGSMFIWFDTKIDCRAFYGPYTQYRFLARDLAGDRQPVQLSGLAFSFSDIGIIGSASRIDN